MELSKKQKILSDCFTLFLISTYKFWTYKYKSTYKSTYYLHINLIANVFSK